MSVQGGQHGQPSAVPATKAARQARIVAILSREQVHSQEQLAGLQRQYADMQAEEGRLTVASQRLQAKVDAFRTRKEAIKAAHAAAEAAAEAAWAEAVIDDASADAEGASSAAGSARDAAPPGPARSSLELSELRPGVPGSAGTRMNWSPQPVCA